MTFITANMTLNKGECQIYAEKPYSSAD